MEAYENEYINEKFDHIKTCLAGLNTHMNGQFINVNEKLENVQAGVNKINGRVSKHDKELEEIRLSEKDHVINCPFPNEVKKLEDLIDTKVSELEDLLRPRIKALEDNSLEYNFFKKYPKAGLIVLLFSLFVLVGAVFSGTRTITGNMVMNEKKELMEQTRELIISIDSLKQKIN